MKRGFVLVLAVAAVAAPAAFAKGRIDVSVADTTPRVGQSFIVELRTGWVVPRGDWLRLIAVAPKKEWFDVVGRVTGDSSSARAEIPNDGFEVKVERVARSCGGQSSGCRALAAGAWSSRTARIWASCSRRPRSGCRGLTFVVSAPSAAAGRVAGWDPRDAAVHGQQTDRDLARRVPRLLKPLTASCPTLGGAYGRR